MYSDVFCKVYNEFGWNYYPEAFGEQLMEWIRQNHVDVKSSMDLACGTGVLCEILHAQGVQASGMDFSEGMIAIARERNSEIHYEVADMITFCPDASYDLVTCTGDALNHILDINNVEKIFRNIYEYLNEGGYFIFDILNENEVSGCEPFDFVFSDDITAKFQITKCTGKVELRTTVFENGIQTVEEVITEVIHDVAQICEMLEKCGFHVLKCSHRLLDGTENPGTTWFVIAGQ